MQSLELKTLQEKICFRNCMEARKYAPALTDQQLRSMYHHLMQAPGNRVTIANDTICGEDSAGNAVYADCFGSGDGSSMDVVMIKANFFKVLGPRAPLNIGFPGADGRNSNNNNNNNNF